MLFKADDLKIPLGPDCACLGMSIEGTFFPEGLLTWTVCTLQLVLLVWGIFFLNYFLLEFELWKKRCIIQSTPYRSASSPSVRCQE